MKSLVCKTFGALKVFLSNSINAEEKKRRRDAEGLWRLVVCIASLCQAWENLLFERELLGIRLFNPLSNEGFSRLDRPQRAMQTTWSMVASQRLKRSLLKHMLGIKSPKRRWGQCISNRLHGPWGRSSLWKHSFERGSNNLILKKLSFKKKVFISSIERSDADD